MAQDEILGSDSVKEALYKLDGDIAELFSAVAVLTAESGVRVSSNDAVSGYLNGKLVAGTNVTLTEGNNGGNETLTIAVNGISGTTGISVLVSDITDLTVTAALINSAANFINSLTATYSEINTVCDGSTAKNNHSHQLSNGATDIVATAYEINTVCNGIEAKNSHTHPLSDGANNVTATASEINTVCDGPAAKNSHTHPLSDGANNVTATASEINTVCDGPTAKNSHSHDDRYYTESEITTALALKANTSISISAGTGLTGGGTLAADRTISHVAHSGDVSGSTTLTIGAAKVDQAVLKTSMGSVSKTYSTSGNITLPGGQYGFYPQIYAYGTSSMDAYIGDGYNTASYTTNIFIGAGTNTAYAQQRYVTASGERHWVFILRDYSSGDVLSQWESPDHPCFGNGGKPVLVQHPFPDVFVENGLCYIFDRVDGKITDSKRRVEIIVINPSMSDVAGIEGGTVVQDEETPDRSWLEVFSSDYSLVEGKSVEWDDSPVTVALPKYDSNGELVDYRFTRQWEKVTPVKKSIIKPNFVFAAGITKKQ